MIEEDDFINQMQHLSDAYENLEREKLDLLDKLRDRELNSQLIQQIEDLIPQEMEKNIGD